MTDAIREVLAEMRKRVTNEKIIEWADRIEAALSEAPDISAFDAAVAAELPFVSVVPYNSHEICKWFAGNVRQRMLNAAPRSGEAKPSRLNP